jgi:hypothetical protein
VNRNTKSAFFVIGPIAVATSVCVLGSCGGRTPLEVAVDGCHGPDPLPEGGAAIFVPPIAFVPQSASITRWSSALRVVLISRSTDACQEFNAFSSGRAPDDARWLALIMFDTDASFVGVHAVPTKDEGAMVAGYCKGEPFQYGYLGWLSTSDSGPKIPVVSGTIAVSAYSEGKYSAGTYDLKFSGGAHITGVFDAGWCE